MTTTTARNTAIVTEPNKWDECTPSDKVYEFVLNKIKTRAWLPSEKIMTESELCAALEVSRVAVREALERLSALGLLIKKQGSGTFVAPPMSATSFNPLLPMILVEEKDLLMVLEFRKHFECGNVRMFMRHHTPADVRALEDNYAEMIANRYADPERAGMLDVEFHHLIAAGTKNPFVVKTSQIIQDIMGAHQSTIFINVDSSNAVEYHLEILSNIKRGNDEIAALFMSRHIEIAMDAVRRNLGSAGS